MGSHSSQDDHRGWHVIIYVSMYVFSIFNTIFFFQFWKKGFSFPFSMVLGCGFAELIAIDKQGDYEFLTKWVFCFAFYSLQVGLNESKSDPNLFIEKRKATSRTKLETFKRWIQILIPN